MAIERHYAKYLKELGADLIHFPAPDKVFDFQAGNIVNKILFKTGIVTLYSKVSKELEAIAYKSKPDVIWIFKGMEILPATLEKLRKDFFLANYNPDHPFIIASRGSGNKNVTDSVGLYHLHFCYHSGLKKQIEQDYKIPATFLPFAYDLTESEYEEVKMEHEINKLCFLGNPDETRLSAIRYLADKGIAIDVYGHGWDRTILKQHKNVTVFDAVYGLPFWKKLRQYRVQLNVFRKHNIGSHNMRTFEIPAAGGIQLAPYSEEQTIFFEADREIFFYRSDEEMYNVAEKLMSMSTEAASAIREQARHRVKRDKNTYADRSFTVFNKFKNVVA